MSVMWPLYWGTHGQEVSSDNTAMQHHQEQWADDHSGIIGLIEALTTMWLAA